MGLIMFVLFLEQIYILFILYAVLFPGGRAESCAGSNWIIK